MVTSDMQRAADLPSRCVQFTTFYMKRFTTVLRKMQTSIFFLLLVIVMDSIKRPDRKIVMYNIASNF